MTTDRNLYELAAWVGEKLRASGRFLVTAESCTGGWIAKAVTDVPGSSQWFDCSFITYSYAAKIRDLGVSKWTLAEQGAVSESVVRQMVEGALRVTGAGVAVATSGIAGPDGGTADKPVGTVWFAVGQRLVGLAVGGSGATDVVAGTQVREEVAVSAHTEAWDEVAVAADAGAAEKIEMHAEVQVFTGDREQVRRKSVEHALNMILRLDLQ